MLHLSSNYSYFPSVLKSVKLFSFIIKEEGLQCPGKAPPSAAALSSTGRNEAAAPDRQEWIKINHQTFTK